MRPRRDEMQETDLIGNYRTTVAENSPAALGRRADN
jgi:hypothetical protein